MHRRAVLASLLAMTGGVHAQEGLGVTRRPLVFPRDFGAHPDTRTEWWYATGWLQAAGATDDAPTHGFQVTFFRSRTDVSVASWSSTSAKAPSTTPR